VGNVVWSGGPCDGATHGKRRLAINPGHSPVKEG
jgi:hypothetical protein